MDKKTVIVTGGSSGIGLATARQLVQDGWSVYEFSRRDFLEEGIKHISCDVTDEQAVVEAVKEVLSDSGRLDCVINCAGFGIFDHTENIKADVLANMVDLNVTAMVLMISCTLPYMKTGSRIMNISSCAGFQPIPYINCYAATKAFVTSYSRALRNEVKYRGIQVLTVTPFWTKTAFFDRAIDPDKEKVVISYAAMYDPARVMKKAIRDLYKGREISCFGLVNNVQWLLVRLLPKKIVMSIWMKSQKLNGTPSIR